MRGGTSDARGAGWLRIGRWLRRGADPLARIAEAACTSTPEGDPSAMLDCIARLAGEEGIACLGAERGAVLEQVAAAAGASAYLQVGSGTGEAALRLARALAPADPARAAAEDARLWLMEPAPARGRWLARLLRHAGLSDRVQLLPCSALDGIPSVHRRFDLIFLRHEPDLLLADLRHAERHGRLRPGTHVVAFLAGLDEADCADYRAHVRESGLYESRLAAGLEVSRCIGEIEAW
jgi:predicted O-methyltransferase YrrM